MENKQGFFINDEQRILRRAPTLAETSYWVRQAQALPDIVED